jgi:DNA-directed RNA polymerase subunit RPC12/RpoP
VCWKCFFFADKKLAKTDRDLQCSECNVKWLKGTKGERKPQPGTDVMIYKIFSAKNSAKKIGVFDSKQS